MFRMSPGSTVWLMVRCLKYEEKIIKVLVPNEFCDVQKNLSSFLQCSGSGCHAESDPDPDQQCCGS
jgi:hypothetical protein